MLRGVPIRLKLAGAVAVPLGALVGMTVFEAADAGTRIADVREQTELARSVMGPSGVLAMLQNERSWFVVAVLELEDQVTVPVEGYEPTRSQTDAAIGALRAELDRNDTIDRDAIEPALEGLDTLDRLRAEIDDIRAGSPTAPVRVRFAFETFDRYTELVEPFFDATTLVVNAVNDPELREGASLADAVARQLEVISQLMRATVGNALLSEGGVDQQEEIAELSVLRSALLGYGAAMSSAPGPFADIANDTFPAELTAAVSALVDQAIATGRVELEDALATVNVSIDQGYHGYQSAVHEAVDARANELEASARHRRMWLSGAGISAVAAGAGLTGAASRSITRSLRSLASQARDLADSRLPDAVSEIIDTPAGRDVDAPRLDAIGVRSRDEVAAVADALDAVQEAAVELAVRQELLHRDVVGSRRDLPRRNHELSRRQRDFVALLEPAPGPPPPAPETGPAGEGPLVPTGLDAPGGRAAPVDLGEVVRSAASAVDGRRVDAEGLAPAAVAGPAAVDLAHVVAELVVNALSFSPPGARVEIRGSLRPDTGDYRLEIVDSGPGMGPAALARANLRLAGTRPRPGPLGQGLGHDVAADLATRHGVRVHLERSPTGGVTAVAALPRRLLADVGHVCGR